MDEEKDKDLSVTAPGEDAGKDSGGAKSEVAAPSAPNAEELTGKLLAEKQELYDRLLRKQAELENFRKRAHKEKEDLRQYAAEDLVRSLLPILDGFERALGHRAEGVPEAYYQGLDLIHRQLQEVLRRAGLVEIDATGELFDPNLHQAVETVVAPGHREQEVVEQVQRGYKLKHRLLRPAMVKVAMAPPAGEAASRGGEKPPEKN